MLYCSKQLLLVKYCNLYCIVLRHVTVEKQVNYYKQLVYCSGIPHAFVPLTISFPSTALLHANNNMFNE